MKVGLLSTLTGGGPAEHTVMLAGGLAAAGVDVRAVCATPALAERLQAAGARVAVVPLRHQLDVPGAVRVRRALAGVDVIHGQDRRAGLWTRLLPPKGAARVYTIHGMPQPYLPPPAGPERPDWRARLAYRGVEAGLAGRADAVIAVSHAVERELVAQLGWSADRITVIPNGVPLEPLLPERGELVGTLTSFAPVKGLEVLLGAAARLPGARFAVFGDGPGAAGVREDAVRLGLGDRVRFPGQVPARDALAQLAVFVLSSHMESAPLALLEAMTAGVPVVATRVGGVPELVPDGTGLLVAPGDPDALAAAIGSLLEDRERASAQAAAARRHVEAEGGVARMTERTLALYERVARR